MATTRRVRWCVLLAVVVPLANAQAVFARPRSTCVTIRVDETVPSVARRVTGDARNMQASWFQIVNPTTSRRVPKTRYGFRFAGWNACIVDRPQPDAEFRSIDSARGIAAEPPRATPSRQPSRRAEPIPLSSSGARPSAGGTRRPVPRLTYWLVDGYLTETSASAADDEAVRRAVRPRSSSDRWFNSTFRIVPSSRGCVSSRVVRDSTSCSRHRPGCVIRTSRITSGTSSMTS